MNYSDSARNIDNEENNSDKDNENENQHNDDGEDSDLDIIKDNEPVIRGRNWDAIDDNANWELDNCLALIWILLNTVAIVYINNNKINL
ncbi:hypothetical protein C1646_766728 [Rhizophagus diaphanus]|nr:hypothetical protein C1646_766728 [Rhizophagus diaphanus] [Rhizophagus sp. MUCL 43196]